MTQVGEGVSIGIVPGLSDDPEEQEEAEEEEEEARVKIRVSLFFDGTLNNRRNTRHREQNSQTYRDNSGSTSFSNDLSNVARMEEHMLPARDYDHTASIYIEGIGTENSTSDTTFPGAALGMGNTGIRAKVQKGLRQMRRLFIMRLDPEVIVEKLTVDAFGFSRGAAAARNFVHEIRNSIVNETFANRTVEELDIGFVGLYDTVAAHGIVHTNDTAELQLRAVRYARFVLQLAAAEEYRENFSLTNINSAGSRGRQIFLPGAHSDVGGGYRTGDSENKALTTGFLRASTLQGILKGEGWYTDGETAISPWSGELSVNRRNIRGGYSHIPLHIMTDFAGQHGLNIRGTLRTAYRIPPALNSVKSEIDSHVAGGSHSAPASWQRCWTAINLRHDYLHFSASTSTGMGLRLTSGYRPLRRIFAG